MKKTLKTKGLLHKSKLYLNRASPTILTCLGAVGVAATAVMAVKATPKALKILELHKRDNDGGCDLPKTKVVKLTWQCYIPAALIGLSTIACIFGANVLNKRNQASLSSAYAMLNQSYQRYKAAAKTVYGEDADSRIKAQVAKESYVSADGYPLYSEDFDTESEKILCYELYSDRYFTATMASVLNAQYHLNRNLSLRGYTGVNEFYEFLGIDKIKHGDEIGWSMDELMEGGIMWLDFNNDFAVMDDGMRCCVISALWNPVKLSEC